MPTRTGLGHFLVLPENRLAFAAMRDLVSALTGQEAPRTALIHLHGPSGAGKSHLLAAVNAELSACGVHVCTMSANDFAEAADLHAARHGDLLIVEDLQHLPVRFVPTLIELLDERAGRGLATVTTSLHGPSSLKHRGAALPLRLTSRLVAGLVVGIEPMQVPSRRQLLAALTRDGRITPAAEILDWLAQQLTGGGRQLTGAVRQLKTLQSVHKKPLQLANIKEHFRTQVDAHAPTVQRIADHVSGFYAIPSKQLTSARRSREVLLPRQVSMYLARQLTQLSLQKIGSYFGGRDHKTVLHACQKVEASMKRDMALSGAVGRLQAELA